MGTTTFTFETMSDLKTICSAADRKLLEAVDKADSVVNDTGYNESVLSAEQYRLSTYPDVHLEIEVEQDLSGVTYRMAETKEIRLQEPGSLWACDCQGPASTGSEESCPIHGHPDGKLVDAAFQQGYLKTSYNDFAINWFQSPFLFPVTSDAIVMYENLLADGVGNADISSVVDVGCGTGILGTSLAVQNHSIRDVYMVDRFSTSLAVSSVNHHQNDCQSTFRPRFVDERRGESVSDVVESDGIDVCVSNPPYLPVSGHRTADDIDSRFSNTSLLEQLIEQSSELADVTYIHISDLGYEETLATATANGFTLVRVGKKRKVPFRVGSALDSDDYTEFLQTRGLEERQNGGFQYWHDIATYRLRSV